MTVVPLIRKGPRKLVCTCGRIFRVTTDVNHANHRHNGERLYFRLAGRDTRCNLRHADNCCCETTEVRS